MKSKSAAYGLWAILGPLGAHRFYLKRPMWTGIVQALLFIPFLIWLPELIHYISGAMDAALNMDLSTPNAMGAPVAEPSMGWAGWALTANQIWWLVDAALIPRWVKELGE